MDQRPPSDPRDAREQTGGGRPVPVGGRGASSPGERTPSAWPGQEPEAGTAPDPESRVDLSGLRRLSQDPPPVKPERPRRDGALPRMVAFFLAAVIFAAAPWYVFTRVLRDDKPAAGPAVTTPPTPRTTASPTPTPAGTPGTYRVVTAGDCLNVRRAPGTDQRKVTCVGNGATVTSDGRLAQSGGMDWLHITYQTFDGWAAAQYLEKAG